ncbi:hypothetical protein [Bradyrhizobium sp. Tv2a-2]|uniref:hypothetical protein n=1 Tax=Bradyrhizobium sp. Tv2a-2 TaxID=113395 RepID=UPI000467630B|nr:hypothetical protein [Bradyrhizobium sp. Tv2a-2]
MALMTPTIQSVHLKISEFSSPAFASKADEAKALVRRCAEPCPAGDSVKEAINRATDRLGFSTSRTQDFWYGEARRIDDNEIDRLRYVADATEMLVAQEALKTLRKRMAVSDSPLSREVVHRLDACFSLLRGVPFGMHVGRQRGCRS